METIFDALKAMGKATSVELAARLDTVTLKEATDAPLHCAEQLREGFKQ